MLVISSVALRVVADRFDLTPRLDEAEQALMTNSEEIDAQVFSAGRFLGWLACCAWDQVDLDTQQQTCRELRQLPGDAGDVMAEALECLQGHKGKRGTPEGVLAALNAVSPVTEIILGNIEGADWTDLILSLQDQHELSEDVTEALDFMRAALWCRDCGRYEERGFIADYASLTYLPYEGDPSEFDAFLVDTYLSGVPFSVSDGWVSQFLPTRQEWFIGESDNLVTELCSEIIAVATRAAASVDLEPLGYKIYEGDLQVLVETPRGALLADKLVTPSGRLEIRWTSHQFSFHGPFKESWAKVCGAMTALCANAEAERPYSK